MRHNRGSAALTVLVVLFGVYLGLFVHSIYHPAYAVIGGQGNLVSDSNPHNLSASSSGIRAVSEEQICIFCHTPHGAKMDSSLLNAPLWNHRLSEQSYQVKQSGTNVYNGYIIAGGSNIVLLTQPPTSPDGASKMCLSCHDGTVAVGAVYSRSSNIEMVSDTCLTADGKMIYNPPVCNDVVAGSGGNNLMQKHVVSIPMNDTLIANSLSQCGGNISTRIKFPWDDGSTVPFTICDANPEYQENHRVRLRPTSTSYGPYPGVRGGEKADMELDLTRPFYKPEYSYGVQCSSCHDPHLYGVGAGTDQPGFKFLATDKNSLCKACHYCCP